MAPARRPTNGRSPLVNPQRQITSFFTKSFSSPSPSPSPSPSILLSKQTPNSHPNPNSNPKRRSPSSSPSPSTPSPLQPKQKKKPLLVIGSSPSSPSTPNKLYGEEVVNKRVKIYWPLDQSWYEGCVKSFDKTSGKHLIQYDDAEEELLYLVKEKIEWVEEVTRKFRRLRRVSVVEDEEDAAVNAEESGGDDESADEDWGMDAEAESAEDVLEGMDLEDEVGIAKPTPSKNSESRKRKLSGGKLGGGKKSKCSGVAKNSTCKVSLDGNGGKMVELKDAIGSK